MGGQCDVSYSLILCSPDSLNSEGQIYLGEFVTHPHERVAMKRLRMFGNCDSEPARKVWCTWPRLVRIDITHTNLTQELIREVRLWSKLSHPNILEFYGLYDAGGMSIYMIAKWMPHGSAPDYLQKNPDANRRNIVSGALRGLCYLHGLKILHGDLKGTNILIKDDLTACLSDLGLARSSNEATMTSLRGNGSTRYMSPEILLTDDAQGIQKTPVKTLESDIFAFGLVIREVGCLTLLPPQPNDDGAYTQLLSDELPYANTNNIAHLVRIIASGYPLSRPDTCVAHQWLCDNMWEVIQKATHQDPKARPTATDLERQISAIPLQNNFSYNTMAMELDSPH
ncbi:hypothetical protein FRC09_011481 [Ceratobasidium sp. 395]|nr:hypothetical protein FRC09_011481 [Ceratobasidium sp. 395]